MTTTLVVNKAFVCRNDKVVRRHRRLLMEETLRITNVRTERVEVSFNQHRHAGENQIDVITGLNGSGKTEILVSLAEYFRNTLAPRRARIEWTLGGARYANFGPQGISTQPERTVAQTFSPFSRFPPPADDTLTLTDVYAEGRERFETYRAVGLHKRSRYIGGVLSRHTLEQGVFRLSEEPKHIEALGSVLFDLGFLDEIQLEYRFTPLLRDLLEAHARTSIGAYLTSALAQQRAPTERFQPPFTRAVQREVRAAGTVEALSELLFNALELLAPKITGSKVRHRFGLQRRRSSEDFAVLQAMALLRRLRAISLSQCELSTVSGSKVDLAGSSSGQQQMLCSIFGLVAELRSNSLVLVDEPELSLHPTWQTSYLDRLLTVLRPFHGCHVLIATHSPLIVQRAQELGCEVTRLHDGAGIAAAKDENVSVEETLVDVFKTPLRSSVYLANELFDLVSQYEGTEAEVDQVAVRSRFEELRAVYAGPQTDPKDREIIKQAEALLLDGPQGDTSESGSD